MGYRKTLPEASQPSLLPEGETKCRPLADVMHELTALKLPVASEAAALLWDMNLQLRRQIGRIHYLETLNEMYREDEARTLTMLWKARKLP